jgi:hypothetical protein
MIEGSESGSIPLTNGSGSRRPKKHVDPVGPDSDPQHCRVGRHLCVLSCSRTMEALCRLPSHPLLRPAFRRPCSTVASWLPSTSSPPTSCSTELFIRKLSSSSSSCSDDSWEFQRLASMCCCWESFMERREAGRSWLKLDGFIFEEVSKCRLCLKSPPQFPRAHNG